MKRFFVLIICFVFSGNLFAQSEIDSVNVEMTEKYELLLSQLERLQSDNQSLRAEVDSLFSVLNKFENLETRYDSLYFKLDELERANENFNSELSQLNNENNQIISSIGSVRENLESFERSITDSIKNVGELASQNTTEISSLSANLSETETRASERITTLDNTLSKNTWYWIIAVFMVGGFSVVVLFVLRKKIFDEKVNVTQQISDTKKALEEESLKLDTKLMEVLETQLKLMKEERLDSSKKDDEIDHSLALKVADEIVRIQTNLSRMDEGTRGIKQLSKSVSRITDNFAANGYEMVDMLGKPYNEGMKVIANFRPDESLEPEQQVITRVIKPQINYKGKMIQAAQIEVSQG
jgi:DNA repair exonuclease SbcCD ATPase subunit